MDGQLLLDADAYSIGNGLTVHLAHFAVDNTVGLVQVHLLQAVLLPLAQDLVHLLAGLHFRRIERDHSRRRFEVEYPCEPVLALAFSPWPRGERLMLVNRPFCRLLTDECRFGLCGFRFCSLVR